MSHQTRNPRIALMGEFSAGKSTLSNLLLGARPLPEKVTATRLSPVWMSYGTDAPYRIDVDGQHEAISLKDLDSIPVEETRAIRLFFEADILDVCDLIDFPGISDPNMSSDVWQRMLSEVDAVIWCTHATQAWRQSEAAVWETMPQAVRNRSALLITRFDKLNTERDRNRVLARLAKETEGLFGATFPISLTDALAAGDDYGAFEASGGVEFLQYFLNMIEELHGIVGQSDQSLFSSNKVEKPVKSAPAPVAEATPQRASEPAPVAEATERPQRKAVAPAPTGVTITPRRVRPQGGESRRPRPRARANTVDMSQSAQASAPATAGSGGLRELRAVFQEKPAESEN